jgi:hypothetical protein
MKHRLLRFAVIVAMSPFLAVFLASAAVIASAIELYESGERK